MNWLNDVGTSLDNFLGNLTGTDPNAWQQSASATLDGMVNDPNLFPLDPGNQYNQDASYGLGLTASVAVGSAAGFKGAGINPRIPPPGTPPPPTSFPPPRLLPPPEPPDPKIIPFPPQSALLPPLPPPTPKSPCGGRK